MMWVCFQRRGLLSKTRIWCFSEDLGIVKDEDLGFFQRRGFGDLSKTRIWDFSKDEDFE